MLIQTVRLRKRDGHPKGAAWIIPSNDELARGVAQVALGQWKHLESILRSGGWKDPPATYASDSAIKTLDVPPGSPDWMTWHRDGWLFQVISWIAAVETNRGPTRPPHVGHAEKGFDGLQLLLSRDGATVKRLVIFEDKATTNPRDTIREDVWPAFESLEAGSRDAAIRSELSSLFLRAPLIDEEQAVNRLMLSTEHRSYRVAITTNSKGATIAGIKSLFAGFADVVPGPRFRRRAHVLELADMRDWMAHIASLAIAHIQGTSNV